MNESEKRQALEKLGLRVQPIRQKEDYKKALSASQVVSFREVEDIRKMNMPLRGASLIIPANIKNQNHTPYGFYWFNTGETASGNPVIFFQFPTRKSERLDFIPDVSVADDQKYNSETTGLALIQWCGNPRRSLTSSEYGLFWLGVSDMYDYLADQSGTEAYRAVSDKYFNIAIQQFQHALREHNGSRGGGWER